MKNKLIVLLGPTAVGKTELSICIAQNLGADIISADSRQIFREIPIVTAAPTQDLLDKLKHHFIASHSIKDSYGARAFEDDVIKLLENNLFAKNNIQLMSGGSMMYIDAVCKGIDDIPDVDPKIREQVYQRYETEGLQNILAELKNLDPIYYEKVDHFNYKRVLHGYEICLSTKKPYSSFLLGEKKKRNFDIIKIGLMRDRSELFARINQRVDTMISEGLIDEARSVYPYKELNSLNTVGLKELFLHFDGKISLDEAIRLIKKNSRVYARKQMTWWRKDDSLQYFHPDDKEAIWNYINKQITKN